MAIMGSITGTKATRTRPTAARRLPPLAAF